MFNITNHEGNANQNQSEKPPRTNQNDRHQKEHEWRPLVRMWRRGSSCARRWGCSWCSRRGRQNRCRDQTRTARPGASSSASPLCSAAQSVQVHTFLVLPWELWGSSQITDLPLQLCLYLFYFHIRHFKNGLSSGIF